VITTNADFLYISTHEFTFMVLLIFINLIGAKMIHNLYEKVLIAQDSVIDLMEQRNELKKILNTIDEKINKWDLKVKEYKKDIDKIDKDIEKEMLNEKKKNIKVYK
tara:strand:- start:669 stop:986 length:318 start_codon:yes stop_codon:yes gene_type:complete